MSILQPVHVRYGHLASDTGQDITVSDPSGTGDPTTVWFSEEIEDPNSHHGNGGAYSLVEGPRSSTGFDVTGTITLWLRDLWAPDSESRTEFQIWMALADVNTGNVVSSFPHAEYYAPIQHDALVWDTSGDVAKDATGHTPSNRHVQHSFNVYVPSNRRLRVQLSQYHSAATVPGYGNPWPGHVFRAYADLTAVPR